MMTIDTRHDPQAGRRRRALKWTIRTTAIAQDPRHDPALDGSTSSYGCDGCSAPALAQRVRMPRRARG